MAETKLVEPSSTSEYGGAKRADSDARASTKVSASPAARRPSIWDIAADEITATVLAELRI